MISCLLLLTCALALNAVVQVPELVEVEVGRTIRLKCGTNGMPPTYCYTIIWTRIDPGTKKLVTLINTVTPKDSGVSEKEAECFFDIENATVDNSGTYYCFVVYGKMVYIGNGSIVIVTQERKTALPPINILLPSDDINGSFAPLLCMIPGVVPQLRMFWLIDREEQGGFTETVWRKTADETVEFTQNQVLVPAEKWERGAVCTCVVEFAGRIARKSVQSHGNHKEDNIAEE
ncbi:hypothetical protein SKAU_G00408090 [Synaphobranchus kaupii]|uniref:Ig-like domain-containing protein n=1 Tax=Synaphobranchus kaupii TaxID=118154 RepID=A0A9Q1EAG3_SYNKA|nr:hypothetical protein SKAU_G00408090 [Synaphobranchus kaupii]